MYRGLFHVQTPTRDENNERDFLATISAKIENPSWYDRLNGIANECAMDAQFLLTGRSRLSRLSVPVVFALQCRKSCCTGRIVHNCSSNLRNHSCKALK
jgi:hypothetical protein